MHDADLAREITKIEDTLRWAVEHHTKRSEADAALHLSGKVLYSPLVSSLIEAQRAMEKIRADFEERIGRTDA